MNTTIMGTSIANIDDIKKIVKTFNTEADNIIDLYFDYAQKEGVRADVAIAQACYETDYFRKLKNNNPANIFVYETSQLCGFDTIEKGVLAHIQQLKTYACNIDLCEPSVCMVTEYMRLYDKIGSAIYVENLDSTWYEKPYEFKKYKTLVEAKKNKDTCASKIILILNKFIDGEDDNKVTQVIEFSVFLGSFKIEAVAESLMRDAKSIGIKCKVEKIDNLFRVNSYRGTNKDLAIKSLNQGVKAGYKAYMKSRIV